MNIALYVFLVILLEGFVTISVEILTIRQLIPVMGNSVVVTSLIIGVFLLSLAIGYWRGGLYKERFSHVLKRNLTIASFLVGTGLSFIFIKHFFALGRQSGIDPFLLLSTYLLLIVAPAVYFLGQTVPLTMNLITDQKRVAEIGGKVLFLSTIGSFLGAPLTSLVFMQQFGVAWSIFINFAILVFLIFLFTEKLKERVSYAIIGAAVGFLVFRLNISYEKNHFVDTTSYGNYRVVDSSFKEYGKLLKGKVFVINGGGHSFLTADKKSGDYIGLIQRFLFEDLKMNGKKILALGAGGFTLSAAGEHGNEFTYVDIDPKIKGIVEKSFLPDIKGGFVAQDARMYLKEHENTYDVIVADTYSSSFAVPPYLVTKEYFTSIKDALKEDGIAMFNIIGKPSLEDNFSKRVDNTLRNVFGNCMVIPITYTELANILYVCNKTKNAHDNTIYVDNLNKAEMDATNKIYSQIYYEGKK